MSAEGLTDGHYLLHPGPNAVQRVDVVDGTQFRSTGQPDEEPQPILQEQHRGWVFHGPFASAEASWDAKGTDYSNVPAHIVSLTIEPQRRVILEPWARSP